MIPTLPPEIQRHIKRLRRYWLVLKTSGPNRDQSDTEAAAIQRGHLEHLFHYRSLGKLAVSGPILEQAELRGIGVYNVETRAEVEAICREDPAVKAGRLRYQILEWGGIAGDALPDNGRGVEP
jgi:uncharacterized protein